MTFISKTGFRNQMLNVVKQFAMSDKNGLFINSCFAHCQTERQDTWFADNSPVIKNKVSFLMHEKKKISSHRNKTSEISNVTWDLNEMQAIALAVGDWYFDRTGVKGTKAVDCPYPCDNSCHNLVFQRA